MKKLLTISSILLGLFLFTGIASASTTDLLQPASTITYNEDLTVDGTGRFNSIYIGETGVGGVTFFNGTIINIGENDPVTFGDDVRIDGQIWGGPNKGNASDQGLKIADTLLPGLTNLNDIGSSDLRWKDLYVGGTLYGKDINISGALESDILNLSGALNGVGANFSEDVQVGNLLGAGVVSSNNIEDYSIQGEDVKNQTLQGQHISTSADLNISQLYAVDGIVTNGNITVAGNVDGINISHENAVWYSTDTDSTSVVTAPGANPTNSKIFVGGASMPACTVGGSIVSAIIDFPSSYNSAFSYSVISNEIRIGAKVLDDVWVNRGAASQITIYGECVANSGQANVTWTAIGY